MVCRQRPFPIGSVGLEASASDPLIMLDDDMEQFPQDWAVRLVQVLEKHPRCVMVSPQLANPDGGPGPMMGGVHVHHEGTSAARQRTS